LQEAYRAHFQRHRIAALMHPVARMPAPAIDTRFISPAPDVAIDGRSVSARDAFGANVTPASLAGCPVLVLPAGLTADGLPVGLSFEALPGDDDQLLKLGIVLESFLGSAPRAARESLALRPEGDQLPESSSLFERGY
jgi:mandelamide amidase